MLIYSHQRYHSPNIKDKEWNITASAIRLVCTVGVCKQCFPKVSFFCSINGKERIKYVLTYSEAVSQKLKEGVIPVFDSGMLICLNPVVAVPQVPIESVCVCVCVYTSRSGTPSFPLFRAFFLRWMQTTVTAMMTPISSRMKKMAPAITLAEYSAEDTIRQHLLYTKRQ